MLPGPLGRHLLAFLVAEHTRAVSHDAIAGELRDGGLARLAESAREPRPRRLERARRDGTIVESPKAFLTTVTTRLAIDQLRSARAQRETYFGPWLPEPLITATEPDPAEVAEMADSLSLSFLVLLETLSPLERAVFLLRDVFEYGYDEIAEIVGKSEANCRQIFSRARKRIDEAKPRFEADMQRQQQLANRFLAAFENGDVDRFVELLAADVVFYGDGGGKGRGLPRPVYGQDRVGRLLAAFLPDYREVGARLERVEINGQPGALNFDSEGRLSRHRPRPRLASGHGSPASLSN